jgi:hypothetical protein
LFEVHASIRVLSWSGKSSGNSFETYIVNMLKIHKEALLLGDPIKELDKCCYFNDGIKSEMFDTFKDNIRAEQDLFDSFMELYSCAKQVKIQKDDDTKGRKRDLGAVQTAHQQVASVTTSTRANKRNRKNNTQGGGEQEKKAPTAPVNKGNCKSDQMATNRCNKAIVWDASKRMENPVFAKLYPEQKAHFRKIRAEWEPKHGKDKDEEKQSKKGNDTRHASSIITSPGKVSLDDVSDSGDSREPSVTAKSPNNQGVVTGDYGDAAGNFGSSAYENDECSLFGDDSSIEDNKVDCRYIGAVEVDDRKPASAPPVGWKPAPAPPEAVVMDEFKPPVVYPQRGPGFPILDKFGRKGQQYRRGMELMTTKQVLEWASDATLCWAKKAYATMYPIWYNNEIVSPEVNKYWKAYEKHEKGNVFPDDHIAELIRFHNHYDCPMYEAEFHYMMKVDCKKLGYNAGDWKGYSPNMFLQNDLYCFFLLLGLHTSKLWK